MKDLIYKIQRFEDGTLDFEDQIVLFAHLIETGKIAHLQGVYQRMATEWMNMGFIMHDGTIDWDAINQYSEEEEYEEFLQEEKSHARYRY
jgi:hypothetical protein